MNRTSIRCCASILLIAVMTSPLFANGGYPRDYRQEQIQNVPVNLPLLVTRDGRATTSLKIPAALLAKVPGHDNFGFRVLSFQTVLAGIALASAAALVFVIIGRRIGSSRAAATVIILAGSCYFMGRSTADIPSPEFETGIRHHISVEITDGTDAIVLDLGADARWAR